MEFLENKYFLIALTFGVYAVSKKIQKRTNFVMCNPILISITAIIIFLKITGIEYGKYKEAGAMIEIWLSPCVVALGVPLYQQLNDIKKQLLDGFRAHADAEFIFVLFVIFAVFAFGVLILTGYCSFFS